MQFFIHCNFFCQEYKFTYLLTYIHLSKKLNNPSTRSKTYWSILKSSYKGNKVPLIPPLLVNNKIVSDFTEKANLFNVFLFSMFIYL